MSTSNAVPFLVLGEEEESPVSGLELEIYAYDDPTRFIAAVPLRNSATMLTEIKNNGGGSFTLPKDNPLLDAAPSVLDWRNVVKYKVDQRVVGGFVIGSRKTVYADPQEAAGARWEVAGEGFRSWFRDAVVYPERGLKERSADNRVFSFASARGQWYKPEQWKTPVNVHKYTMDPNDTNPWNTAPAEWPDVPDAYWIWGTANAKGNPAAPGNNYFRYEFSTNDAEPSEYSIFASADDDFDVYVDANQVITTREDKSWALTRRADFTLSAGEHVLAIRVKNKGGNAGLIAALFKVGDADTETPARLLTYTGWPSVAVFEARKTAAAVKLDVAIQTQRDAVLHLDDLDPDSSEWYDQSLVVEQAKENYKNAFASYGTAMDLRDRAVEYFNQGYDGWKVCPYPAEAPGWTPGEIMHTLLAEARARGVRFPNFLTPTFTALLDSNGVPWPRSLDWQFAVGSEYTTVIAQLEELVCDVWVDPETLELNMEIERGIRRDVQSSSMQPILLEIGKNILKADEAGKSDLKNALVVQSEDGWSASSVSTTDSLARYGRVEGLLSTGASPDVSAEVAEAVFKAKALPEMSATFEILDTEDTKPFRDFQVGDWVLAPGEQGLEPRRVMSISVAETDATGHPVYAVEFGTIQESALQRHERWLKTASDGSLGGSVANASISAGSGSGTFNSGQAATRGAQGPQGKTGAPGINWRGTWSPLAAYAFRDSVSHRNSSWIAKRANADSEPSESSEDWDLLSPGFNWRGAWSSTASYFLRDLVIYQGSTYAAWMENTGQEPGTGPAWGLIASKGDKGDQGLSAYAVALADGFVGTVAEWQESLRGLPGAGVPEEGAEGDLMTFVGGFWQARPPAARVRTTLLSAATGSGSVSLARGFKILSVEYSAAARLRLYRTQAGRSADSLRPFSTLYLGGATLLYDYLSTGPEVDLERPTDGAWAAGETAVHYLVDGTADITLTWVPTTSEG